MAKLPVLSPSELAELQELIATGREHLFYVRGKWLAVSEYVRTEIDHGECQMHKARGRYAPAELVHHVQHLKRRPDLALSIFDEAGRRQLVSLCKDCHDECHPERLSKGRTRAPGYSNAERWD